MPFTTLRIFKSIIPMFFFLDLSFLGPDLRNLGLVGSNLRNLSTLSIRVCSP